MSMTLCTLQLKDRALAGEAPGLGLDVEEALLQCGENG